MQLSALLCPQAQVDPVTWAFSDPARSHVHCPAGRARHEHLAPATVFSAVLRSQVQCMADCLPQEHVAFWAQTQASERPQQVLGLTILFVAG